MYNFRCRHADYLEITDDNNVQVGQYCGDLTGNDVFVSGDFAVITFHSDYLNNTKKRGYQMLFNTDVKSRMPGKCKSVEQAA